MVTSMFTSISDQVLGNKEAHEEESTMETGTKLSSGEPGGSQGSQLMGSILISRLWVGINACLQQYAITLLHQTSYYQLHGVIHISFYIIII
nr:unnamed protein product [Callosobruchus chinensis]